MKLRIMLADDHQIFRDALRSFLEKNRDLEVVAEAGNGLDVISLAREFSPDIVCMDIGMPGMNGVETTRRLVAACPGIKVIALSAYFDQHFVLDMMRAGALAYVTKAETGDELLRAIAAVRQNRSYFCPNIANVVANVFSGALFGEGEQGKSSAQLGARERQVLQMVAEGCTSVQIAGQLHIAASTVEVHRRNIMRKLNMHTVAELTRYAIHNGLTPT
ncbi:MAG: response regulator [Burkholderiales bacterium]